MSKNVKVNGTEYSGVSIIQLPTSDGGNAQFQDVDEITEPSGSVSITENGTHDVSGYAQAVVNVESNTDADTYEDFVVKLLTKAAADELTEDISFTIPEGIKRLRDYAMALLMEDSCLGKMYVTLPDSLEEIGSRAFYYSPKLVIGKLPPNLKAIGSSAFGGARSIFGDAAELKIPSSVETLRDLVFYQYDGSVNTITFEGTPSSIAADAIQNAKITTINVPWAEGAVANAPWGATAATINYNYTGA